MGTVNTVALKRPKVSKDEAEWLVEVGLLGKNITLTVKAPGKEARCYMNLGGAMAVNNLLSSAIKTLTEIEDSHKAYNRQPAAE